MTKHKSIIKNATTVTLQIHQNMAHSAPKDLG